MKIAVLLAVVCLLLSSAHCYPRRPKVVPNGSSIVSHGDHMTIEHPDGSSQIKRLSPSNAARSNDNGWIASVGSNNNYTYYSAEWVVPPIPVGQTYQLLYFKNSFMDIPVTGIIQVVLQFYHSFDDGTATWSLSSWWTPWNGDFIQSAPIAVTPGSIIRGVIELVPGNKWNITGYVNGTKASFLQVAYTPNMYIEFPSHPGSVLATTSDTAAQSYLTVYPYNASKTAGRLFTFTNDGFIRLASNPNLVLDVEGTLKEGARVLVYPQKKPTSLYQQWSVRGGRIYSKLGNQTFSLTVNTINNRAVLTLSDPQEPYINYQRPAGGALGQTGSAQWALEVYNVFQCQQYPPSNRLDVSNIVLKKGTATVAPTWSPSITPSDCRVSIASPTSSAATLTWNSTIVV